MKKLLLALPISLLMASCSQNEDLADSNQEKNKLNIITEIMPGSVSRAIKTGTSFTSGDILGLYLLNSSSSAIFNGASNVQYSFDGSKWSGTTYLSATEVVAYAYYPYSSSSANTLDGLKKIAVSAGNTDYLWGKSSSNISTASTTASITMKHALAQIAFTFTNSNSPNACALTKITLKDAASSTKCYKAGTMDATTGTVTSVTAGAYEHSVSLNFKSSTQAASFVALPMSVTAGQTAFVFTIDNKAYTLSIPAISWEAGKKYTYPVTMAGENVVLSSSGVTITDWTTGANIGSTTFN